MKQPADAQRPPHAGSNPGPSSILLRCDHASTGNDSQTGNELLLGKITAQDSVLGWAIQQIKLFSDTLPSESLFVETNERELARLAAALGAHVVGVAEIAAARDALILSPWFPLAVGRAARECLALLSETKAPTSIEVVARRRHHPAGAFTPREGRMDFSGALDGRQRRELEESRFVLRRGIARYEKRAASESPPTLPFSSHRGGGVILEADPLSGFELQSERDLAVLRIAIERGLLESAREESWSRL